MTNSMEIVKEKSHVLPRWIFKGNPVPDFAEIEYKRLRLTVHRVHGRTSWFATAHPLLHTAALRSRTLEEAQLEALDCLRDKITAYSLKLDIIARAPRR